MWGDYPGYYAKFMQRQKRQQNAVARRERKEKEARDASRYMRKIKAQFRWADNLTSTEVAAWTPLSDINYRMAEFFVSERLQPLDEVALILEAKDTIYLKAKVVRCHEYESTNRVITPFRYRYRAVVTFLYESPEEQTLFQDYLTLAAA